ncbi:hypothetical protein P8C59_006863 [Phyllachora maydis]|uniref:Uncharacterized protein n=1 Tax=Phyllachora maydis TaxID=1825666 RepID=A0AAD9I8H8_9PEZI|nr:hypothetical protein P8C59_006863 [Phyllachora maydis]
MASADLPRRNIMAARHPSQDRDQHIEDWLGGLPAEAAPTDVGKSVWCPTATWYASSEASGPTSHGAHLDKNVGPSAMSLYDGLAALRNMPIRHRGAAWSPGGAAPEPRIPPHTEPSPRAREQRATKRGKATRTAPGSRQQAEAAGEAEAEAEVVEEAPESPVCYFFDRLACETRNDIYRYLLVDDDEIPVMNLWTQVFQRERPKLYINIMRTCKLAHDEGARILYGENCFCYRLRDAAVCPPRSMTTQSSGKAGGGSGTGTGRNRRGRAAHNQSGDKSINFDAYRANYRNVVLELEPTREGPEYQPAMVAALDALSAEGPSAAPRLQTVTLRISPRMIVDDAAVLSDLGDLDVSDAGLFVNDHEDDHEDHQRLRLTVVDYFAAGSDLSRALRALNANTLRLDLHEPGEYNVGGELLQLTLDLRGLPAQSARHSGVLAVEAALAGLRDRIQRACVNPAKAVEDGEWERQDQARARRAAEQARRRPLIER